MEEKLTKSKVRIKQEKEDIKDVQTKFNAENSESNSSDRRVGKMLLLKSGKIRFVTVWGDIYDVESGLAVSFAQYLVSIQGFTPKDSNTGKTPESSNESNIKKEKDDTEKTAITNNPPNEMAMDAVATNETKGTTDVKEIDNTKKKDADMQPVTPALNFMGRMTKKVRLDYS